MESQEDGKCEMRNAKCEMQIKCGMRNAKCEMRIKCGMRNAKCEIMGGNYIELVRKSVSDTKRRYIIDNFWGGFYSTFSINTC